jgi:hypothetical protein
MPAQSTLRHTGVGMVALAALLAVLLAPAGVSSNALSNDPAPASADDRLNLVMSQPAERAGPGGGLQERKVDAPFGGVPGRRPPHALVLRDLITYRLFSSCAGGPPPSATRGKGPSVFEG